MATSGRRLSGALVKSVKAPRKYLDENGLRLRVYSNGNKCWEQQVTIEGRRTTLGLGGYPVVSLGMAREQALQNLRDIWADEDPRRKNRPVVPTIAEAATIVLEQRRTGWTNPKEAQIWKSSFERYVLPIIGDRLVSKVTAEDLLKVLKPIWIDKQETARRLRTRLGAVMEWAQAKGYRSDDPARGPLTAVLPRVKRVEKHHPALPHEEVGSAIATVNESRAYPSTKRVFEFVVLTAARSGEARGTRWDEIDFEKRVWTVPPDRMKTRETHSVPLSDRALAVLEAASQCRDESGLVFPSPTGRELSNVVLSKLLRTLEIAAVPHGFRSSFRDWCGRRV